MMSGQSKDDLSFFQGLLGIVFLFFIFGAGRCSADGKAQTFGSIIPPAPSQKTYVLPRESYAVFKVPEQFRGDVRVPVSFMVPESVGIACGEEDWAAACQPTIEGAPEIILPNPCRWYEQEDYASMVCHELAHVNGWKHPDRGDPDFPEELFEPRYPPCRPPLLCKGAS